MVAEFGIKLAINLISAHFGDLVSKVCECLLRRGTLTLSELSRYTEFPQQQIKNCLLVLIQHNCVLGFDLEKEGGFGIANKVMTHYTVIFENILHRIRFSKFLAIVSDHLGRECEELLEGLLQHGRLSLEQIILRAVSNQIQGDSSNQDILRENFVKLVNAHYVERCPASVPLVALPTQDETPSTAKRGAKSAKLVGTKTIEQRAMAAAIPPEAERFSVVTDTGTDVKSGAKSQGKNPNVFVGEKRKLGDLEIADETNAKVCEKEVLWRANFDEFVHRLRNKACIANVRSRLDDGAGIVLSAIVEATRSTAPLSINLIYEEVIKSEEGRSMNYDHVRAALLQLGYRPITGGTEEAYSVDLRDIIESAQNDEVESMVLKKYGRNAYSIFRLLSMDGRLIESDKISATTLVDKKDALGILYNLWKDDYLQIQKTESHGPQSKMQFLLWKVNKSSLKGIILNEMYHAVLNLTQRIAYELEKEHEILQLPKDKRVGDQGKRFQRIRKVRILLESCLMKLDDALMLFHDFVPT